MRLARAYRLKQGKIRRRRGRRQSRDQCRRRTPSGETRFVVAALQYLQIAAGLLFPAPGERGLARCRRVGQAETGDLVMRDLDGEAAITVNAEREPEPGWNAENEL